MAGIRPGIWTVGRVGWRLLALAAMSAASWWSLELAYADRLYAQATLESVQEAVALEPDNPIYHTRLATLLYGEDPDRSTAELQATLQLNPRDSKTWIEIGIRAEFRKDYATAERCFLEAARVDRQYVPRWTLMNYYFRRRQPEPFWRWAREAAAMSFGDLTPMFRLCLRMTADASSVLDRLKTAKPDLAAGYLSFLLSENRSEALGPVAQLVAQASRSTDTPLLLIVCDRLLAGNHFDEALDLWNRLCDRGTVPYQPISAKKATLTNSDWRLPPFLAASTGGYRKWMAYRWSDKPRPRHCGLQLSSRQPEICDILSQVVPVAGSTAYVATLHYRTSDIPPESGLGWTVIELPSGRNLAASLSLSSEEESSMRIAFDTLQATKVVRLGLAYRRAIGTTTVRGTIWLSDLRLQSLPR